MANPYLGGNLSKAAEIKLLQIWIKELEERITEHSKRGISNVSYDDDDISSADDVGFITAVFPVEQVSEIIDSLREYGLSGDKPYGIKSPTQKLSGEFQVTGKGLELRGIRCQPNSVGNYTSYSLGRLCQLYLFYTPAKKDIAMLMKLKW